jgi:hypothetical protein
VALEHQWILDAIREKGVYVTRKPMETKAALKLHEEGKTKSIKSVGSSHGKSGKSFSLLECEGWS